MSKYEFGATAMRAAAIAAAEAELIDGELTDAEQAYNGGVRAVIDALSALLAGAADKRDEALRLAREAAVELTKYPWERCPARSRRMG